MTSPQILLPQLASKPLWDAISIGRYELVASLLTQYGGIDGPCPDFITPLEAALYSSQVTRRGMRRKHTGITPSDFIRWLLESGATATPKTANAAVLVCQQGRPRRNWNPPIEVEEAEAVAALELLREYHGPLEYVEPPPRDLEHEELNPDCDWAYGEDGYSPMHTAVVVQSPSLLRTLAGWGCNVEIRSTYGLTPAAVAALRGERACLETLISLGASVEDALSSIHANEPDYELPLQTITLIEQGSALARTRGQRPLIDGYRAGQRIYRTVSGEMVRSKSEVVIANALHWAGCKFSYERRLESIGAIPDFTIELSTGEHVLWEHLGMMSDAEYDRHWRSKERRLAEQGYIRGKNLVVTRESDYEVLDSFDIQQMADALAASKVPKC